MSASTFLGSRALLFGASALLHVAAFGALAGGTRHGDQLADVAASTTLEAPIDITVTEPAVEDHDHDHEHAHFHTHAYPVSPDHDRIDHDPSIQHTPYAPHDHADPSAQTGDHAEPAAASEALTAEPAATAMPLHFTISIGNAATAHGSASGDSQAAIATAPSGGDSDAPVAESLVSTRATLASSGVLTYPAEAREQEIEADVPVEIVVSPAGVVTEAKALSHTGYGLDEAAVAAVRGYRFHPAQRGGRSVAVRMHWDVAFKLR